MKEPIIVPLKAKHFENASYCNTEDCPAVRAAKEHFNERFANAGGHIISIGKRWSQDQKSYYMNGNDGYGHLEFSQHQVKAEECNFDDTVVGEIVLTIY